MTDKKPEDFKPLTEEEQKKVKQTLRKSFDEMSDEEKKVLAKNIAKILRATLADGKIETVINQMVEGVKRNPDAFRRELEKKVK